VTGGLSAPADVPRVDSYIADTMTSLARFRRQLAGAEARFAQLVGTPAPIGLERAPSPPVVMSSSDAAAVAAQSIAPVRAAMSAAEAARQDSEAARAERLPQIGVGVDAGRYGVLENDRDFDIRLRLGLRQRLFGGVAARARQAEARSEAAGAFAERVREEAVRDAEIAWSDVRALEEQLEALETSYIAARKSRDAIVYRFRAGRSSLFDIIAAETTYFNSAAAFVQALTELDIARYVLLSRTGRLLDTLGIEAPLAGTQ
jgi:adhesin transport system outer membrane protein